MNHTEARDALRELGIRNPSATLIENYLRAAEAEEESEPVGLAGNPPVESAEGQPDETGRNSAHSGKSNLEPVLRDAGTLERPSGPRKQGRPRIIASWFPKVAEIMADGTSLKFALAMCGLSLSRSEIRACYRNKTLQAMYQEARRKWLAEHYGRKPSLRAKFGRFV